MATAKTTTTEETVAHTEEGGIVGAINTFGIKPELFAAQLVNFLIVLLVLWKFAYKPIIKMLAEREKKIAESIKNSEEIERRLKEAVSEQERIVQEARVAAQALAVKTIAETEERKVEMVEAAKKEVERLISKGKDQLAAEQAMMLKEARKDLVEIAVKAAAKILADGVDEKKSKSLAEEVVRKLT